MKTFQYFKSDLLQNWRKYDFIVKTLGNISSHHGTAYALCKLVTESQQEAQLSLSDRASAVNNTGC